MELTCKRWSERCCKQNLLRHRLGCSLVLCARKTAPWMDSYRASRSGWFGSTGGGQSAARGCRLRDNWKRPAGAVVGRLLGAELHFVSLSQTSADFWFPCSPCWSQVWCCCEYSCTHCQQTVWLWLPVHSQCCSCECHRYKFLSLSQKLIPYILFQILIKK